MTNPPFWRTAWFLAVLLSIGAALFAVGVAVAVTLTVAVAVVLALVHAVAARLAIQRHDPVAGAAALGPGTSADRS